MKSSVQWKDEKTVCRYIAGDSVILGETRKKSPILYEAIADVGKLEGVKRRSIGFYSTLEAAKAAVERETSYWVEETAKVIG